jgi:hypothetical protein
MKLVFPVSTLFFFTNSSQRLSNSRIKPTPKKTKAHFHNRFPSTQDRNKTRQDRSCEIEEYETTSHGPILPDADKNKPSQVMGRQAKTTKRNNNKSSGRKKKRSDLTGKVLKF